MTFSDGLDIIPVGDGRFQAGPMGSDHGSAQTVVFGGQLLAQTVMAAARTVPDKSVKSLHTVFARGASTASPLDFEVDVMHAGRAFASATVSVHQQDRLCSRSLVLLDAADPDLIRHQAPMPSVAGPGEASEPAPGWQVSTVGAVDISDPSTVGPPELFVWTRFPGAPADLTLSQASLAYATDGFLIGTAMRPHPGVGQALAHVSISTTVLTHTLTFHEPFDAGDWLLLAQESPYSGRGRSYGRALVYAGDGRLVASFVQESMIRDMPDAQRPAAGEKARF